MKRLATILLVICCLFQFESVTVPSRAPVYPDFRFVRYDAEHRTYYDYGVANENWCRFSEGLARDACSRPDPIPAKDRLVVKIRELIFKEEDWQRLAVGGACVTNIRAPWRQKDESGTWQYVFDCNIQPIAPRGTEVVMHNGGSFVWRPDRVELVSAISTTKAGDFVRGYDLINLVSSRTPLNGVALEYLMHNQEIIPEDWYQMKILFLGTVFRSRSQQYQAGMLFNDGIFWRSAFVPLDFEWEAGSVGIAVLT